MRKRTAITVITSLTLSVTCALAVQVPIPEYENGWYRSHNGNRQKVTNQVYRPEALVLAADQDYVDVLLCRVTALLDHMTRMRYAPDLSAEAAELERLQRRVDTVSVESAERAQIYNQLASLRRRLAFRNPLLDFDDFLFVEHDILTNGSHGTGSHMCDQYYGYNAQKGGGLFILFDAFSAEPQLVDLCAGAGVQNGRLRGRRLTGGAFLSPDLSYDGQTVVFAWCEGVSHIRESGKYQRWNENTCWHIFKINIDGTGLEQLTDGPWDDFDPIWLPNGRIVFNSTRRGGFGRCHGRPVPTYTLHGMKADGSDLITLSWHETNDANPCPSPPWPYGGLPRKSSPRPASSSR